MAGLDADAVTAVYSALVSHAQSLGLFDRVAEREPLSPPGTGLTLALIEGTLSKAPSGLAATSLDWAWLLRIYSPWRGPSAGDDPGPGPGLDAGLTAAAITLMASYASDLDLTGFGAPAGLVRDIDVLGSSVDPRWLDQDGSVYRLREISVTVTINDAYAQGVA